MLALKSVYSVQYTDASHPKKRIPFYEAPQRLVNFLSQQRISRSCKRGIHLCLPPIEKNKLQKSDFNTFYISEISIHCNKFQIVILANSVLISIVKI